MAEKALQDEEDSRGRKQHVGSLVLVEAAGIADEVMESTSLSSSDEGLPGATVMAAEFSDQGFSKRQRECLPSTPSIKEITPESSASELQESATSTTAVTDTDSVLATFQAGLQETLSLVHTMTPEQKSQAAATLQHFLNQNQFVVISQAGAGDSELTTHSQANDFAEEQAGSLPVESSKCPIQAKSTDAAALIQPASPSPGSAFISDETVDRPDQNDHTPSSAAQSPAECSSLCLKQPSPTYPGSARKRPRKLKQEPKKDMPDISTPAKAHSHSVTTGKSRMSSEVLLDESQSNKPLVVSLSHHYKTRSVSKQISLKQPLQETHAHAKELQPMSIKSEAEYVHDAAHKQGEANELSTENEDSCLQQDRVAYLVTVDEVTGHQKADVQMVQEGDKWKCTLCGKLMQYKHNMTVHLRHHTGDRPFRCCYCTNKPRSFTTVSNYRRHVRVMHKGKEFKLDSHEGEEFPCEQCQRIFRRHQDLQLHMNTTHGNRNRAESKLPPCPICHKSFKRKDVLEGHMAMHKGEKPFSCPTCFQAFTFKPNLLRHMKIHTGERPHKCTECDAAFIEKKCLERHRVKFHSNPDAVKEHLQEFFECEICQKKFTAKHNMLIHQQNVHEGKKPYTCSACGRSFSLKSNMLRHERTHRGERNYSCPVCSKTFTEKKSVTIHLRQHTGEKPYKCPLCDKHFSQHSILKAHMPVHHRRRDFLCGTCGKTFLRKSHYMFHVMKHNNPPKFPCKDCSMKFYRKTDLTRHALTHTNEKPFPCTVCSKRFTRQQYLNDHMNLHIGLRLHRCRLCSFTAPDAATLQNHKRQQHHQVSHASNQQAMRRTSEGSSKVNGKAVESSGASMIVKLLTGQLSGHQVAVKEEQQPLAVERNGSGSTVLQFTDIASQAFDMDGTTASQAISPGAVFQQIANQTEAERLQNQMAIDSIISMAGVTSGTTVVQEQTSEPLVDDGTTIETIVLNVDQLQEAEEYQTVEVQNAGDESHFDAHAQGVSKMSFQDAVNEIVSTVMVDEPELEHVPTGSVTEIQVPIVAHDGSQGEYVLILKPSEEQQ